MERRTLATIGLAVMLLLAGCAGASLDDGEPEVDGTSGGADGSTPDDDSSSADGEGDRRLDPWEPDRLEGVEEGEIVDPGAFLDAHESAIAERSMTVSIGYELEREGGSVALDVTGRSLPDENRALLRVESRDGEADFYTEGETTYVREHLGSTTYYRSTTSDDAVGDVRETSLEYLLLILQSATYGAEASTVDGPTATFTASDVRVEELPGGNGVEREAGGQLVVDRDGIVREASVVERIETDDGETYRFRLTIAVTDVGSTDVERPEWIDRVGDDG